MSDLSRHEADRSSRLARAAAVCGTSGKLCPAERATQLLEAIIKPGDRVALMINNLGGTPLMELAIVARHAVDHLEVRGVSIERAYMGTFLSALEMAGVSLSVLRVDLLPFLAALGRYSIQAV